MNIIITDLGKRFNTNWIFRKINYSFLQNKSYAITGPNGSGKSTFLQVLAGAIEKSEGSIIYTNSNNKPVAAEHHYTAISLAAPYMELIEEFTLKEFFEFHFKFKQLLPGHTIQQIVNTIGLANAYNKQIRNYSSGMKQRVKLAQAFYSNVPVVLLDEPTTNLDAAGITLYKNLFTQLQAGRLFIVASNDADEIALCNECMSIV
jgi:ABC-type multidrug transport system ATPase subunit